jgi:hypothetical protein
LGSIWLCFLEKPNKDGHSLASFFQKIYFKAQEPEFRSQNWEGRKWSRDGREVEVRKIRVAEVKFPAGGNLGVLGGRTAAGLHFNVCMLRENTRRVDQENETVSF